MGRAAPRRLMFVLPEAFLFLAAVALAAVALAGRAAGAVRRAVQELRGAGGQPKTVPALLLLPVLFLWEEAFANPLWYGAGCRACGRWGLGCGRSRPAAFSWCCGGRGVAAVVAVFGLIVLGLVLLTVALSGCGRVPPLRPGQGFLARGGWLLGAAPGVFSGLYGPVALVNQDAVWLTRVEGVALLAAGCMLVPRMVAWAADRPAGPPRCSLDAAGGPPRPDPQRRDRVPRSPNCAGSSATCTTVRRPGLSRSACRCAPPSS